MIQETHIPTCCGKKMTRFFQTSTWECLVCGELRYDLNLSGPNKKSIAKVNSLAHQEKKNDRMSSEDILLIRKLKQEGLSIHKISKKFNIGWIHCKNIIEKGALE